MNPKQQRTTQAEDDQIGDLRERMAKVETICKMGFPALALYITALKFVPAKLDPIPSAPINSAQILLRQILNLF